MNAGLIRVRDFAQSCGCTPQNIYGHLKTYKVELEGHTFQGKGRQGVLLDEHAQAFLRSVMYPKEISADTEIMAELNRLRADLLQLGMKNTELAARLATAEGERDKAVLEVGHYQRALTASQDAEEVKQKELDDALGMIESYERQSEREAEARGQLIKELQQANEARQQVETKVEALMHRGLIARILNKGVD